MVMLPLKEGTQNIDFFFKIARTFSVGLHGLIRLYSRYFCEKYNIGVKYNIIVNNDQHQTFGLNEQTKWIASMVMMPFPK